MPQFRDLFSLQVDMVFYDLTSTYFEGHGPPEKGAHGHSVGHAAIASATRARGFGARLTPDHPNLDFSGILRA
jgi:hypothetical protein